MYAPLLGRFLSPDTLVPRPDDPQSFNRYSYARHSPLRLLLRRIFGRDAFPGHKSDCRTICHRSRPAHIVSTFRAGK